MRTAAAAHYTRTREWPQDAPAGVVPTGLEEDLLEGFSFDRGAYLLDWERWTLPDGSGPEILLGISIATEDELLGNAVAALIGAAGMVRPRQQRDLLRRGDLAGRFHEKAWLSRATWRQLEIFSKSLLTQ